MTTQRIPVMQRFLRFCMILLGVGFVLTEMTFSTLGSLKASTDVYAYGMVAAGIFVIAAEAFMAHRTAELRTEKNELWIGGAALWVGLFIFAMYFTATGANVRTEAATASRVYGYVKRENSEKATAELERDLVEAEATIKRIDAVPIDDGGKQRGVRPVKSIKTDGRYIKTEGCPESSPKAASWSAGMRAVCQEYGYAVERENAQVAKAQIHAKLAQARDKLDNTAVVLDKNSHDASLLVKAGMSPDSARFAVALFFGALLNLASSMIWFYIPSRADLQRKYLHDDPKANATQAAGLPHNVHVHVGQQAQAQPPQSQVLVLNEKDEALRRWAETIPAKPN